MADPQTASGGAPGYRRGHHAAAGDCGGTERPAGAAAYLMKRADASALIVTKMTGRPIGIITEADISQRPRTERTRTTSGFIS